MTTEEFVQAFYKEKQNFLKEYISPNSTSEVALLIRSLNLNEEQNEIMNQILDTSLTDVLYTILLGLDGTASIGGIQEMYNIKDEKGNQLSEEIEAYAFEYFQNKI